MLKRLIQAALVIAGMTTALLAVSYLPTSSGTGTALANVDCGPMDVTFAIDTTGSMFGAIGNVQAALPGIVAQLEKASGGDLHLGVVTANTVTTPTEGTGDGVNVKSALTSNVAAVQAILTLPNIGDAPGGGNLPEGT